MRIVFYSADFLRTWSLGGSVSGSSEGLLRRGEGEARMYRNLQQKPGSRTAGNIFQSQRPVLVYQSKGKHSVWAFENQRQGLASSRGGALVTWPVWRRADRDSLLHCPSLWLWGRRPAYLTGIVCCHEKNTFTEVFGSVSFFWPKYVYVFIYRERGRLAKPWKQSVAYQKNTSFKAFFSH